MLEVLLPLCVGAAIVSCLEEKPPKRSTALTRGILSCNRTHGAHMQVMILIERLVVCTVPEHGAL